MRNFQHKSGQAVIAAMLVAAMPVWAAEPVGGAADPAATTAPSSGVSEIEQLRQMLIDQQRQINELRRQLQQQQAGSAASIVPSPAAAANAAPLAATPSAVAATPGAESAASPAVLANESTSSFPNVGQVASTTAIVPRAASLPAPLPQAPATTSSSANPCDAAPDTNAVPAFLRLGSICIVPIGFMDLTALWRDKNAGSGIGTSFGSIPYNNNVNSKNSEMRFSPQNSRIGFRIDGDWKGTHFIGYNEFDFLGTSGSTSLTVTNGAFVPRLRLFWVDARKSKIEFLAGQSWSMFTPNRTGISALPGDLFYSQVIDVNYMAGLTWTRQPGMRVLFHPSDKVTFGFSAENPDQYIGGSAGGSGITLPSALSALASTQLDNAPNIGTASTVLSIPVVNPDFIAKLAIDPSSRFHFEVGGIERTFKIFNPNTGSALGAQQHFTSIGSGILAGLNAEIFKNFRLITTNAWGEGIGRYLFGQAPDLIVRDNGSLSLVHAAGTVDGFETRVNKGNLLLYAYYGGIYIDKDVAEDTNGSYIGYGYPNAGNGQNRSIQELTFGFNQTIWANPRYGAINMMGQYMYVLREPWYVALNAAGGTKTHDNTIFFNIRYTLPGAMPRF